jgi:hypothetical protein
MKRYYQTFFDQLTSENNNLRNILEDKTKEFEELRYEFFRNKSSYRA